MDRKIRMVLLDGLTADDVLKLKAGGFFDGVEVTLPAGVTGQQATLKVQDPPHVVRVSEVPVVLDDKLSADELANNEETMRPVRTKKPKAEPAPAMPTPSEVIQQTQQVEQQIEQPPVEPPVGNGKKLAAKNARQNARYIVFSFGQKWAATFIARGKGGLMFKLDGKAEPNVVGIEDGALIEELDAPEAVAESEVAADDVDLSVDRLAGFTKLRDLIQYAIECGIPAEGMAAFCEGVKAEVPLLSRISNIADRVQRTLEVMGAVS
jgi:hypothetical protein